MLKTIAILLAGTIASANGHATEEKAKSFEELLSRSDIANAMAPAGLEKMFFEFGVPLADGATTALPPSQEEIQRLLAIAPKYGSGMKRCRCSRRLLKNHCQFTADA